MAGECWYSILKCTRSTPRLDKPQVAGPHLRASDSVDAGNSSKFSGNAAAAGPEPHLENQCEEMGELDITYLFQTREMNPTSNTC